MAPQLEKDFDDYVCKLKEYSKSNKPGIAPQWGAAPGFASFALVLTARLRSALMASVWVVQHEAEQHAKAQLARRQREQHQQAQLEKQDQGTKMRQELRDSVK